MRRGSLRNKFGVAPKEQRTYNGVLYASKAEAEDAIGLDLLLKAKAIRKWERQTPLLFAVKGVVVFRHYVDFKVTGLDGSIRYIERKGVETPIYKLKMKLLLADNPTLATYYEVRKR